MALNLLLAIRAPGRRRWNSHVDSKREGSEGLRLLYVLSDAGQPALGGAQARLHGLMSNWRGGTA
jgi:hypothetical protein